MSPGPQPTAASPRGDRRREAILTALDERLRTTALDDISVADLTDAAGITRSAFYFYFESKAAAVTMLLVVVDAEARKATEMIVRGPGEFRSRVRAALELLIDRVSENGHIYRALLTARTQHEPTRDLWNTSRRAMSAPIAEFIAAERAAGRAPEGADPAFLAEGLIHINETVLERRVYHPEGLLEPLLATASEMWVRTVYGRPDPAVDSDDSPDPEGSAPAEAAHLDADVSNGVAPTSTTAHPAVESAPGPGSTS